MYWSLVRRIGARQSCLVDSWRGERRQAAKKIGTTATPLQCQATVAAGTERPLNTRALESPAPALTIMAKAGARYEVETGNIWGYAHRVRAADVLQDLLLDSDACAGAG